MLCVALFEKLPDFFQVAAPFYIPSFSVRVPGSPRLYQHLCPVCFFRANLVGVKWQLTVVLSHLSLMTDDVERLYVYFLAICISLEKTEHFCCMKSESPLFGGNSPSY